MISGRSIVVWDGCARCAQTPLKSRSLGLPLRDNGRQHVRESFGPILAAIKEQTVGGMAAGPKPIDNDNGRDQQVKTPLGWAQGSGDARDLDRAYRVR